jgi:hypothetical protein
MNKRSKNLLIFKSSKQKDKNHLYITDKYFKGNIEVSDEFFNELKKLINE